MSIFRAGCHPVYPAHHELLATAISFAAEELIARFNPLQCQLVKKEADIWVHYQAFTEEESFLVELQRGDICTAAGGLALDFQSCLSLSASSSQLTRTLKKAHYDNIFWCCVELCPAHMACKGVN